MEFPELPVVLNWIFKLLLLTAIIFLSRKFQTEINESGTYFRFGVWMCVMFGAVIVVNLLAAILFNGDHSTGDHVFRIMNLLIKLALSLLILLVIGRILYRKFYQNKPY